MAPAVFTKTGGGVLTLSASSSYTGETILDGGTLRLATAPTAAPAGAILQLDASILGLAQGESITAVTDLSASGNDAAAGVSAPTYNAPGSGAALNGKGTIHFAEGQSLATISNLGITGSSDRTMLAVMRRNGDNSSGTMAIQMGDAAAGGQAFGLSSQSNGAWMPNVGGYGAVVAPAQAAGQYGLFDIMHQHANDTGVGTNWGYLNGALVGTTASLPDVNTSDQPLQIGTGFAVNSGINGDFAEVLVYNAKLNDSQRKQAEAYLNYKWLGIGASKDVLPTTTAVTIHSNSTLDLNGAQQTIGALSGQGLVALNNGTLTVNSTANSTFDGVVTGLGTLAKSGPNTLTLTGANVFGHAVVSGGTLQGDSVSLNAPITLSNNATVAINQTSDGTFAQPISGTGNVLKTGAGVLTLSNSGSYNGTTRVSGGTLRLENLGATAPAGTALWLDANDIDQADGTAVTGWTDKSASQNNMVARGTGGILKVDANNNKSIYFSGGVNGLETAGNLGLTGDTSRTVVAVMSFGTGRIVLAGGGGGAYQSFGIATAPDFLEFNQGGNDMTTHWGPEHTATVNPPASIDPNLRTPDVRQTYEMTHNSDSQVSAGYLEGSLMGANKTALDTLDAKMTVGINGWGYADGTVSEILVYNSLLSQADRHQLEVYLNHKWNGAALPTGNVLPANTAVVVDSGSTLDVNGIHQTVGSLAGSGTVALGTGALTVNSTANSTFSGAITGDGTLVKQGASTLALAGTSSYVGGTTVSQGILEIDSTNALHGNVTIGQNGKLLLASSLQKSVRVSRLTFTPGIEGVSAGSAAVVPEPSTVALLAAGAVAAAMAAWRRRKQAARS